MNKKLIIITILVITLLSAIFILNTNNTLSPERPTPISNSKIDDVNSQSEIFIPISISSKFISNNIESTVPRSLREELGISISGVKDEHVIIQANRNPLNTTQDATGLSTSTSVSVSASVRGKVRPFGPRFSQTARGKINFALKTKPEFQSNWKIKPNLMLNYSVPRSC